MSSGVVRDLEVIKVLADYKLECIYRERSHRFKRMYKVLLVQAEPRLLPNHDLWRLYISMWQLTGRNGSRKGVL